MAHARPHLHDLAAARVLVFRMRDTAGRAPWQSSALAKGDQPALRLTQRRKTLAGMFARSLFNLISRGVGSMDSPEFYLRRRLQVVADANPGAIARVVERFQNLNIIPRRLCAEFSSNDLLHISVEVCGISEKQLALIIAKIRQAPCIVNAHWARLD